MAARAPSWDQLYETASTQQGHFTTQQAAAAGYSAQLLRRHVENGRITRVRRGVYRLVHFPPADNDELVVIWLWTEQQGVLSHETALALHGLSDVLPSRVHVTLPLDWEGRRLRVPKGVAIYFSKIASRDRVWIGSVPATSVRRTLADCIAEQVNPELIEQGLAQAARRGVVGRVELSQLRSEMRARRRIA